VVWTSYLLVVVAASLLPPGDLPVRVGSHDKLWHAAGYALAMLMAVPLWQRVRHLLGVALALAVMGAAMEVLQGLAGYRSMELADAVANASGVLVGLLATATPLRGMLPRDGGGQARRPPGML
jgi:VanZ family protein